MFVITNRGIEDGKRGLDAFSSRPNAKGPNELRVFEATKRKRKWSIDLLPDELKSDERSRALKMEVGLPLGPKAYASQYVARRVLTRVRDGQRDLVFFVHGYNNDLEAVLERGRAFERTYGVEVVAFSWPSNGGGVRGAIGYKSDKRDARASAGAVYQAFSKAREYLRQVGGETIAAIEKRAAKLHPDNHEKRHAYITRTVERACPFKVSLVAHSMGNYLLKHIHTSSAYDEHHMLFDNVVLVAADTNSADHARWVDEIRCRNRVYITINEDDSALMASRIKAGEEQRARLGHWPHDLVSRQAVYVNVTEARDVGSDHAYFEGAPVKDKRRPLYRFFREALHGRRAEDVLSYNPSTNSWRP